MKILKARLYDLELQKQQAKLDAVESAKKDIAFGSQIRSYVLQPYRMVKDHRTKYEVGDVDRVLDGDLDDFIKADAHRQGQGHAAGRRRPPRTDVGGSARPPPRRAGPRRWPRGPLLLWRAAAATRLRAARRPAPARTRPTDAGLRAGGGRQPGPLRDARRRRAGAPADGRRRGRTAAALDATTARRSLFASERSGELADLGGAAAGGPARRVRTNANREWQSDASPRRPAAGVPLATRTGRSPSG